MNHLDLARIVAALGVTTLLAVVGALPRVRAWQERFSSNVLATTGFFFLLLGFAFRELEVLPSRTMADLQPVYEFGLGWVGFTVGMQLKLRRFDRLPPSLVTSITLVSAPPVVFTAFACSAALLAWGVSIGSGLIRDVVMLAACAAVSAAANLRLLLGDSESPVAKLIVEMTELDQLAAFALLAYVSVNFRPDAALTVWRLPRTGWFLVMVGVGFTAGALAYVLIRRAVDRAEELAFLLGSIALAAGIAGYLALSVPVVSALAGAVLANVPLHQRNRIEATLRDVDRPIYLLLLFVVGSSWRPDEWQGWALGVIFALARGYGKLLGARVATRIEPLFPTAQRLTIALLPESAIAIIVIFSLTSLHAIDPPAEIRWAINAVIVGSVLTEVVVQIAQRRIAANGAPEAVPS